MKKERWGESTIIGIKCLWRFALLLNSKICQINVHYYIKYYFQKNKKKNTLSLFNFISPEILSSYWYKIFLTLDTPHPLSLSRYQSDCHSISCPFTNKTRTKPHNKSSKIGLAEAEAEAVV